MRFRWKNKRNGGAQALSEAREDARVSLEQAHADLAREREACELEEATIVGPLRRLREANHFADTIAAAFRDGR